MRSRGVAATLAALTLLAACSSTSGRSAASSTAPAGSTSVAAGVTVKVTRFNSNAAMVTTEILSEIVRARPGLGIASFQTTAQEPTAGWTSAKTGAVDLMAEVTMPDQESLLDGAADTMSILSQTYSGANRGWFVPAYTVAAGGPATGLVNIDALNGFAKIFGGVLYDGDPNAPTTAENTKRIAGYHVSLRQVPIGQTGELKALATAVNHKKPILLYLQQPAAVFAQYKLIQLKEPNPYTDNCFTTGNGACAMQSRSANIVVSSRLRAEAPTFVRFLSSFSITLSEMQAMLKSIEVEKRPIPEVAAYWVRMHQAKIASWSGT